MNTPLSHLNAEPRLLRDHPAASATDCTIIFAGMQCPEDMLGWQPQEAGSPLVELINRLEKCAAVFHGRLDRLLADGAIFIFEPDGKYEAPALRGVQAAEDMTMLDLQLAGLDGECRQVGLRLGIADGPVPLVMDSGGTRRIAFITDTLNRASRLERDCQIHQADIGLCGSVVLALRRGQRETIHALLEGFRPAPDMAAGGKAQDGDFGASELMRLAHHDPTAGFFRVTSAVP